MWRLSAPPPTAGVKTYFTSSVHYLSSAPCPSSRLCPQYKTLILPLWQLRLFNVTQSSTEAFFADFVKNKRTWPGRAKFLFNHWRHSGKVCINTFDHTSVMLLFPSEADKTGSLNNNLNNLWILWNKAKVMRTTGHFSCGPHCLIHLANCECDVSDVTHRRNFQWNIYQTFVSPSICICMII